MDLLTPNISVSSDTIPNVKAIRSNVDEFDTCFAKSPQQIYIEQHAVVILVSIRTDSCKQFVTTTDH